MAMDYDKDFNDYFLPTEFGKVHYKHHGGKSASIIFIHGLAGSTRTWLRLAGYLPKEVDTYLIDLLGHGESDAPEIKYTVAIQEGIIRALVEREKLSDVYLFGHSYGGWVSAAYARDYGTKGIILEDSAGLDAFYEEVAGSEEREKYKNDTLEKAVTLDARKHVIESILDDEFREGQLKPKDLESIKTPTLIIWGENDAVIGPKFGEIFRKGIKGSRLSVVSGARHTPHFTNAKEVSSLLLDFIDQGTT